MVCVYCGSSTVVVNSRKQRRTNSIWRRRKCTTCLNLFTTEEHVGLSQSLMFESRDGLLAPFRRDQLFVSIFESCKHRQSALPDAASLTQQIINRLVAGQSRAAVVARSDLVRTSRAVLQPFDKAAATMYDAYHPL